MESPQKKRRLMTSNAKHGKPAPAAAEMMDSGSSQPNAKPLDMLLQAMENREKETRTTLKVKKSESEMGSTANVAHDYGTGIMKTEGHRKGSNSGNLTMQPPAATNPTSSTTHMAMPSITSSTNQATGAEDDHNAHFELSQTSLGEKMLKQYEPLMHEVLGPQSTLSQELKEEFHPMENGADPTTNAYPDSKPPFLYSQGNIHQQSQHPSSQQAQTQSQSQTVQLMSQYQQASQDTQSQQFPMTQQQSQFSMTVSSLPSLGISQMNSAAQNTPSIQPPKTTVAKPPPYHDFPSKSITKTSILRTKTTKLGKEAKKENPNETGVIYDKFLVKSTDDRANEENSMQDMAKRAADLINTLATNKKVEKQLLLSMTLTRQSPRSAANATIPPPGTKLTQGFQWAQFPPLEKFLRKYMEEYYELSIEKCQSVLQQEFNNKLVKKVIEMATFYGWTFDFTHKGIRDRVRCYFKTHIQNAKKRLKTMCKNPTKKANAKALCAHLDLIEMHKETQEELEFANDFMKDRGSTFGATSGVLADDDDEDAAKVLAEGFK